jgi:hypothetical protein
MNKKEASTLVTVPRSSYIIVTILSQYFSEVKILTDNVTLAALKTLDNGQIICNSKHSHEGCKGVWGTRGIAPYIFNLITSLR